MLPDDKRHGTRHGYRDDRCRCDACKKAIALEHNIYWMRRTANGGAPLSVSKVGAVRRIQALMAMGWPRRELARQAGYQGDAFSPFLNGTRERLNLETNQRVTDLYNRLSMTPGPSPSSRIRAAEKGWAPPLAWDEESIDDPAASPAPFASSAREVSTRHEVDEVVVQRFLTGDHNIPTTRAEREAIVATWVKEGRTIYALEQVVNWKTDRYINRETEVA